MMTPMRDESTGFSAWRILLESKSLTWAERSDHEAEVCPLAQKIAVDIDAVRLTQVLGDESADGGQILGLKSMFVLDVAQFARKVVNLGKVHGKEGSLCGEEILDRCLFGR